jgi:hypothetical protein
VIALGQTKTDNITQMITITDDFIDDFNNEQMVPMKSNHIKHPITLTMITLSSFHCTKYCCCLKPCQSIGVVLDAVESLRHGLRPSKQKLRIFLHVEGQFDQLMAAQHGHRVLKLVTVTEETHVADLANLKSKHFVVLIFVYLLLILEIKTSKHAF